MTSNGKKIALVGLGAAGLPALSPNPTSNGKKIAVLGAGAAGLAAAKYLLAEGFLVTVFETKASVGGVWNTEAVNGCQSSPVYEGLETNVPRTLMTLSDFPWPTDTSLFPTSSVVKEYLQGYAMQMQCSGTGSRNLIIQYNTKVVDLRRARYQMTDTWKVSTQQRLFGGAPVQNTEHFTAVVVATGNYHEPHVPETPGRDDWHKAYPDSLTHSIHYRRADNFRGKTVLVVGNSASGWDISSQLAGVAAKVIVASARYDPSRGTQQLSAKTHEGATGLQCLDVPTKTARFTDGSVRAVDKIIFCTGYKYDFDFIKKGTAACAKRGTAACDQLLFDSGVSVRNVFRHMFYTENASLAFVGLPTMSAAFTVAEAQSAVIARVWSGRLDIPGKSDLRKWYEEASVAYDRLVQAGQADPRHYHSFRLTEDKAYVNHLLEWSLRASTPTFFGDDGQPPPYWCECLDMARGLSRETRDKFQAKGDRRHMFTSYRSLGIKLETPCAHGLALEQCVLNRCRCRSCFIG